MGNFEKISKMNLAELEAPEEVKKREEETEEELSGAEGDKQENNAEPDSRREEGAAGGGADMSGQQVPGLANGDMLGMEDEVPAKAGEEDADAPKEKKPQKIMDPQGRHYTFATEVSQKHLTSFLFGHTYRNPLIIVTTILAIIWPIAAIVKKQDKMYIPVFCAIFILLWLPFSTWNRGKNAKKQNPQYQKEFQFMFDEWGLHLQLGDDAIDAEWKRFTRTMELKNIFVLYTGKSNAFIIPTDTMGAQKEEITGFIKEMLKKNKK